MAHSVVRLRLAAAVLAMVALAAGAAGLVLNSMRQAANATLLPVRMARIDLADALTQTVLARAVPDADGERLPRALDHLSRALAVLTAAVPEVTRVAPSLAPRLDRDLLRVGDVVALLRGASGAVPEPLDAAYTDLESSSLAAAEALEGRLMRLRLGTEAAFAAAAAAAMATLAVASLLLARGAASQRVAESGASAARERLGAIETLLAGIVSSAEVAIVSKTLDGIVTSWNAAAERVFGYTAAEMIGRPIAVLAPDGAEDDMRALLDRVRTGARLDAQHVRRRRRDGTVIDVRLTLAPLFDTRGRIVGAAKIARDITAEIAAEAERKRLAAQLAQAQKMEAIGQLSGGLAHDFNNLLGIVVGNLDFLDEELAGDPARHALVAEALRAAMRGADLTHRLLAFARRQALAPARIEVAPVLRDSVGLLRRTLGESITVELFVAPDTWPVVVDVAQLESAILNLAVNARDAMPDGGRLAIEARNTVIDDPATSSAAEVRAGAYVTISVSDTGCGMAPEVLARVFEPFFSTKGPQGSGLGLSMVHGFVSQSGGHTSIYSEPGHGTRVCIRLPRAAEAGTPAVAEPEPLARGGTEAVLVVEDNEGLRTVAVRRLRELGYSVSAAASGPEALEALRAGTPADLLFTDVVMQGGMDGRALARAALELRPGLAVLFTSGFADPAAGVGGRLLGKPYRREELAHAVRTVLEAARPGFPPEPDPV